MKKTGYRWILLVALLTLASGRGTPIALADDNYTVILGYGQTPYQLGYLASGNNTGWNWWDTDDGGMPQKNLIIVSIMENTSVVSGLSPPAWIQDSSERYTGAYSWRAGSGIHSWHYLDNYSTLGTPSDDIYLSSQKPHGILSQLFNWLRRLFTGRTQASRVANLTFYTKYNMSEDHHGYLKVSTDHGAHWETVADYTGDSGGWVKKTVNLTRYSGENLLIAFQFFSPDTLTDGEWWIDEIKVTSDGDQVFSCGAETPPPRLQVKITYPSYTHTNNTFTEQTKTIDLVEDSLHQLYYGVFNYPDDAYTGRYRIVFNATINSTEVSAIASFNTTLWGCQARGCHDAYSPERSPWIRNETTMIHPDSVTAGIKGNCLTMCHSTYASQFLRATPIHLHEIRYGHEGGFIYGESGWIMIFNNTNANVKLYRKTSIERPITQQTPFDNLSHVSETGCTDCHTTFVHTPTGAETYEIAAPQSLKGRDIGRGGVHQNVSCEACHGLYSKATGEGLYYPPFDATTKLNDTIRGYLPEFMSYESMTNTYIIDMNGSGAMNVTVSGDDPRYSFLLSLVGPIDDTTNGLQDLSTTDNWYGTYTVPSLNGTAVFGSGSKIYYPTYSSDKFYSTTFNSPPRSGVWIARVFPLSDGSFNYTIRSSHPIRRKPVIHIPWNCSECHNKDASGAIIGARTLKQVPSWDNRGLSYTHTDINNDGRDDITCRLCHNSFHKITIRNCTDCHVKRPPGHTMTDYPDMSYRDCIFCHSDPHFEPERAAGGNCTDCHLEGGLNVTTGLPLINRTGFFASVHHNITGEFSRANYTRLSRVCWGCHVNYSEQLKNPSHTKHAEELPECEDCHYNTTPLNENYLKKTPLQAVEHQPSGEDVRTDPDLANCTTCHNKSLTITPPTENVRYPRAKNYVSHYAEERSDMWVVKNGETITDCTYCHQNGGNEFNPVFSDPGNANITHGVVCTDCHGSGRIHSENLTSPTMEGESGACLECHDEIPGKIISPGGFRSSAHKNLNCIDCHTPRRVYEGMIAESEVVTYNFTIPANTIALNATLEWSGVGLLELRLRAPDGRHYAGNRINISTPEGGNWTATVSGASLDAQFTLTINASMRHPGSTPKECEVCHTEPGSIQAPLVYAHTPNGSSVPTNTTCVACHVNDAVATGRTPTITAAHYLTDPSLETGYNCVECHTHTGVEDGWGDPPDPRDHTRHEWVKRILVAGEPWKLVDNYTLTLIEATREGAIFDFEENGRLLRRELVADGDVFEYEVRGIAPGKTAIVNLTVKRLFASEDGEYVAELSGSVLASRIHRETENEDCWECHDSQYRARMPNGRDYYVLKKDRENVTLARLTINFTDSETRMLGIGKSWDLGSGYVLHVADVNQRRGSARLQLYRDGRLLEDMIVNTGEYFTYEEWVLGRKIDLVRARLESVFIGSAEIVLSDVRVISDELKELDRETRALSSGTPLKYLPLDSSITVGDEPETFHIYTLTSGGYGADCISCHSGNGVAPIKIDMDRFKKGVHSDLNSDREDYTSFITDDRDRACWACHGNGTGGEPLVHPTPYLGEKTPLTCIYCHGNDRFGAEEIHSHYPGSKISTAAECWDCHGNTLPEDEESASSVSHYSTRGDLPRTSECGLCHDNTTNGSLWGDAPQVERHNSDNNCTRCHAGRGVSSFHDAGITITRGCESCHLDRERSRELKIPQIKTHYPGAPEGRADTLRGHGYTCEICHNITNGTLHESLEVLRYNESLGYCFQCHSVDGGFPYKPDAQIRIFRHGRGVRVKSGCEACHDPVGVSKFHTPSMVGKRGITRASDPAVECEDCHEPHEGREYQPFEGIRCIDCHTEYGSAHYSGVLIQMVDRTATCKICHNSEADLFHNLTHLEANVSEEALRPCYTCHGSDVDLFNETQKRAIGITRGTMYTVGEVADEPFRTCTSCHNATGESNFHFDEYPRGTVENPGWDDWVPGKITGCKDCHTYHGGALPFNATNMGTEGRSPTGTAHGFAPNCTICHGGSDPISLHSLASTEFVPRIGVTVEPDSVPRGEICLLRVTVVLPPLMKVTRAEYFIDEPGLEGTGRHLKYIIGESNQSSAVLGDAINTSMLYYGEHVIYTRVKDSAGKWSRIGIATFTVTKPERLVLAEFLLKVVVPLGVVLIGIFYLLWRRFR
ncbi:Cytochrome c7 c [Candidatus Methanoperedenaceae archaeon GB37]|nr:Cytochrome c7 c [Candidatus Methanoperedenaceae archaeon GB37]